RLLFRQLLLGDFFLLLSLGLAGRLFGFLTLGLGDTQPLLLLGQLTLGEVRVFLLLLFLYLLGLGLRLLLLDLLGLFVEEVLVKHDGIDDLPLGLWPLRFAEVDPDQQNDADDQVQQQRRDEITGNTTLHIHLRQFT